MSSTILPKLQTFHTASGQSYLVTTQAHNLKVVGSNPTPPQPNIPFKTILTRHRKVAFCVVLSTLEALWKQAGAFEQCGGLATIGTRGKNVIRHFRPIPDLCRLVKRRIATLALLPFYNDAAF